MCLVPNMAVFCISLISCFSGMLLMYCLSDFEMVPFAPIITAITFVFTEFLLRGLYILNSSQLLPFLITILSPGIATSIYMHYYYYYQKVIVPTRKQVLSREEWVAVRYSPPKF
jgi:hypothetical protein